MYARKNYAIVEIHPSSLKGTPSNEFLARGPVFYPPSPPAPYLYHRHFKWL